MKGAKNMQRLVMEPPVCKIMDFLREKYDKDVKQKERRNARYQH